MADKAISELVSAERITATDRFVLEQNGTAKQLTGQVLLNWLTAAADGHGGIQNIEKFSTSGLEDTYRITLADTTTFDFVVTNGKGISEIKKTKTSGLVDTYTITYTDSTTGTYTVTNGEKGEPGDNAYVWIKYASQEPDDINSSMGDIPDTWIGIYTGTSATAPTDYRQYKWSQLQGEVGREGGYWYPSITQVNSYVLEVTFIPSRSDMGHFQPSMIVLPSGPKGDTGESGVYTLAQGETIDDVPDWAQVVVDPYSDPATVKLTAVLDDGSTIAYKLCGEVVPE